MNQPQPPAFTPETAKHRRSRMVPILAVVAALLGIVLVVATVLLLRGDGDAPSAQPGERDAAEGGGASVEGCDQEAPAILSGGTFRTMTAVGYSSAGVDAQLVSPSSSTNFRPCSSGLSYAVLNATGFREPTVAFAVFVDGAMSPLPVYLISGAEVTSADPSKIVVEIAYRKTDQALAEPPATETVTITLNDGKVVSSPDLTDLIGNGLRLKLDDQPMDPSAEISGPKGDSTTYKRAPQEVYGPTGDYTFQLPSTNISCKMADAELKCYTRYSFQSGGQHCANTEGPGGTAQIVRWKSGESPCTDFWGGIYNENDIFTGPTLEYGTALQMPIAGRVITCFSREQGLACEDPKDWGFTLAREGFTRYRVG